MDFSDGIEFRYSRWIWCLRQPFFSHVIDIVVTFLWFLVLPRAFWFCREFLILPLAFWFCREFFVFAVSFLFRREFFVLP